MARGAHREASDMEGVMPVQVPYRAGAMPIEARSLEGARSVAAPYIQGPIPVEAPSLERPMPTETPAQPGGSNASGASGSSSNNRARKEQELKEGPDRHMPFWVLDEGDPDPDQPDPI